MPPRKNRKKYPRRKSRKNFRRKGKRSDVSMVKIRGVSTIPDKIICKLKYTESIGLSSAGLAIVKFRGNSLFDPDFTGAGHQPKGFDQWAALYSRYKVYGSSIKLLCHCGDTGANVICVAPVIDSTAVFSSMDDMMEARYSKYKFMTPVGQGPIQVIKNYSTTKSIRGERIQDDDYSALVTNNPSKQWFWYIGASTATGADAPSVTAMVTITYYCEFLRPTKLPQS